MKVRIVQDIKTGHYKIQYKFLWWWVYFTRTVYRRHRDIEGNELNLDYTEHLVFNSVDEAEMNLRLDPPKGPIIKIVKEFTI